MIPRGGKYLSYCRRAVSSVPRKLVLLGSTGSIGVTALDIVADYPDRFKVVGLGAGSNVELLASQVERFSPSVVAVADPAAAGELRERLGGGCSCEILVGDSGVCDLASSVDADLVLCAIVGFAGLRSTLAALRAGRDVALANKESLVVAGEWIAQLTAGDDSPCVLPVDSEHSAVFQALYGLEPEFVGRIILTASGGPFFRDRGIDFRDVTPEMALNHPRWKMGPKVTIDSATMFNKGLELIEARWLFSMPPSSIDVLIHPQSIVHSMIETVDGSVMAQLGVTDMRGPIGYAFSFPERLGGLLPSLGLSEWRSLEFFEPDYDRFPSLRLAREAAEAGGGAPCVLNAANEVAVEAFLSGRLGFDRIPAVVGEVLSRVGSVSVGDIDGVFSLDRGARETAWDVVRRMGL